MKTPPRSRTNRSLKQRSPSLLKRVYRWIMRIILFPVVIWTVLALHLWKRLFTRTSNTIAWRSLSLSGTYSAIEGYFVGRLFDWLACVIIDQMVCGVADFEDVLRLCDGWCAKRKKRERDTERESAREKEKTKEGEEEQRDLFVSTRCVHN